MTEAQLKARFRQLIKVVPGGPPVGTPGANRAEGVLAALDMLVKEIKTGGNGKAGGFSAVTLSVDPNVGNKYALLTPDLLLAVQALIAAGKEPVWIVKDAGAPLRTQVLLASAGVKNDGVITNQMVSGGTDNAPALMAVLAANTAGAFRSQKPVELVMPAGGIVAYAAGQEGNTNTNKWGYGYNDLLLKANGATLIAIYPGNDNFFSAFLYRREMLQNNGQAYRGTKTYFTCARIATVAAGSSTVTAINPADIADLDLYGVGKRICVYSRESVLGEDAYPPSTKHNETPRLIVSRTATTLTLDKPLEYEHRADYPENPFTSGGGGGRARIVPLDAPGNEYPERFEVVGPGTLQSSNAASPGAFGWIANVLVVGAVTITNGATVTETLTSATFNGTQILGEFEGDKMVGYVFFNGVLVGFCSNWGGVRRFTMVGGKSTKSLQVAPPEVFLDGVECWASSFTTTDGVTHAADSAVASYTGFHNTGLFRIKGLKVGADNNTTGYISPVELRTATVTHVDGQRAGFYWNGSKTSEANLVWRGAQPGTRYHTLNGSKVGRQVGETQFTPDVADCTSGTMWVTIEGFTPAVGDKLEFSNVLAIVDEGGHTILTPNHPARLYSDWALIWKNNQRTDGTIGPITITKNDLFFTGTAAYVVLRGKPTKITLILPTAAASGRLLVVGENKERQSESDDELVRFGLGTAGTRYASAGGASAGLVATNEASANTNQYRPAAFGAWQYTLVIYFDQIEQANIPDFTLTIEHNQS